MGALTSLASVAGAAASLYGNLQRARSANAQNAAQVQIQQQQEAAQQQVLLAQRNAEAAARQQALARTMASARARIAAGGAPPDSGSGAALQAGLARDAASVQQGSDQVLQAEFAAQRPSLLAPDNTLAAALSGGRTFGYATRSLLD